MNLFAYIDPGTGSLILQGVIGVVLAAGLVMRNFVKQVFGKAKAVVVRRSVQDE